MVIPSFVIAAVTRTYKTAAGAIESEDILDYDDASRLITGVKGRYNVTTDIAYDLAGRNIEEITTVFGKTYTMSAGYDEAGRPTHLTFPDGKVQETTYDARSLPVHLIYGGDTLATLTHNPAGLETTRTFGNGIVESITYGRDDQLRTAVNATTLPGGSNVGTALNFTYSYDATKRILSESPANNAPGDLDDGNFAVTYDDGGRVTTWERDDNHA